MHQISCLCGQVSQTVEEKHQTDRDNKVKLSLCHCDGCRHSTGLLCVSYLPISEPRLTANVTPYVSESQTRYFCSTCGCHIFRCGKDGWGVATGTIYATEKPYEIAFTTHDCVSDTLDGGISVWMPFQKGTIQQWKTVADDADSLEASCACNTVSLRITRPNVASREPQRDYPDLMYSYSSTGESIRSNPSDEKWWIQSAKYLAGTCACRSCRLASGFEVQTWAFIPRANISIKLNHELFPLDFENLPSGILDSYASSAKAIRDFCGKCGATVFWRERDKADVVDVSVGLMRASSGARAEEWLRWWTGRVSFSEDVECGRLGSMARAASELVLDLSNGLGSKSVR